MQTPMGYEFTTTLVQDFQIASVFGEEAVRTTYQEVFNAWKHDIVWMTEMYIALNWEIWRLYESGNKELAFVYNELWDKLGAYVYENFEDDDLRFFFEVTD